MPTPVLQRFRCELRYESALLYDDGAGARAWCMFEQTSTSNLATPGAPTAMRTWSVVAFILY